jgi:1-deoxy-D-xylulose-5-phosphate synthase
VTSLLAQVHSPEDLKRLAPDQLPALAAEIRHVLLETLAQTGGHLGANLGVVELTLALHYVFTSPHDSFVWDVSHQCYTHKLLTGRQALFPTLRQLDGLSGFAKRAESPHDLFEAGHGGTSLSAALGMARARALQAKDGRVVAVIGDGALTSGMALEALNDAGHANTNLLVVLNDNAMAISPNVGGMARYLSRLRSEPGYLRAKGQFETLMGRLPGGITLVEFIERLKAGVKQLVIPGMLFEELGFTYLGPIDGHDLPALMDALRQARRLDGPVLVHVLTTKGKGYAPAESHQSRLHGVPAFKLESGEPRDASPTETYTEAFGRSLCALAAADERVVAITAAMCENTGLTGFRQTFPARFFDVAMAEEHAVTMAAGLATEGMRPVVAIYSTFLQRGFDQILHDVCQQNLPVVFALDRAGVVEDGPTHHGAFDLSYLRLMPNLTLMVPATLEELAAMLAEALRLPGPCALRYPRGDCALLHAGPLSALTARKASILRAGDDVALMAVGTQVVTALAAADRLAHEGIRATVVNARFVKPLDAETLMGVAQRVRALITLEENTLIGGFGSAVAELLQARGLVLPRLHLGLPDAFVEQGPRAALLARVGLEPEAVVRAVHRLLPTRRLARRL